MRIGVVAEGPTDAYAIREFLRQSLGSRGVQASFVMLQPDMDKTRPNGGWGMVIGWLTGNPPGVREHIYLGGGLFDGGLSAKSCDIIVFQMDTDNLSKGPFRSGIGARLGRVVQDVHDPIRRGNEIRRIIEEAGRFEQLSEGDRQKHIIAPAVESTETWCVGVFRIWEQELELLRGDGLGELFMTALHVSESRGIQVFASVDKSPERREKFCKKHAKNYSWLETQCYHYRELVENVMAVGA